MPKSLADVKAALEAIADGGAEMYGVVTTSISEAEKKATDLTTALAAEKDRGIKEVNKRNRENEGLRKFKTTVETLGFDPDESELEDFTTATAGILEAAKTGVKPDVKTNPEFKSLQKDFRKLTTAFDEAQTQLKEEKDQAGVLRTRTRHNLMRSKIMEAIGEKVYGPDLVASNLISTGKVKVDDDEQTVLFVDGDNTTDFDDGVKKLLEDRKDIVKNNQTPGGGSKGKGGDPKPDKMTDAERTEHLRKVRRERSGAPV